MIEELMLAKSTRIGFSLTLLISSAFLFGAQNESNAGVRWSPLLKLDSRQEIGSRLALPFGDVFEVSAKGEKETVANCNDYLRVSVGGFDSASSTTSAILHNDGVECVALNMLRSAKTPKLRLIATFAISPMTLSELPPELAPVVSADLISKARAADAAGKSWKSYEPNAVASQMDNDRIEVTQPGWTSTVTLYASGDFSGNGRNQLLIRSDYKAEGGTYGNSKLFLLERSAKAKRLQLVREIKVR